MIICGQNNYTSPLLNQLLSQFTKLYKAVLLAEYMANIECEEAINPFLPFETHVMSSGRFEEFIPDIVISLGTNVMSGIKQQLRDKAGRFEHWGIEESGDIVDMYKSLINVFECSPEYFFQYFIKKFNKTIERSDEYINYVKDYKSKLKYPTLKFSNNTVIRDLAKRIPDNSVLHLSINNSIRLVNFFGLPNRSIKVFANIGTHGIDGCLSSFIGQSVVSDSNNLNFLIIGDLSFFYDMGAMRIKHIPKTCRILLINNYGGGEFHYSTTLLKDPTMDLHTSAAHHNTAKGWVESVGFKYYSVHNDEEYQQVLNIFLSKDSEQPILIEVFSDMEVDATTTHALENINKYETTKENIVRTIKNTVVDAIGAPAAKRIINKLK